MLVCGASGLAIALPALGTPLHFQGKVYQVDTIYNNVDVIMPDRTRTFWADGATQVRVQGRHGQLIDIAMGDRVRGTYRAGPKSALILISVEDLGQ